MLGHDDELIRWAREQIISNSTPVY
jgi:hypothetical protein